MKTENIQKFLMPPEEGGAYTDEKLAALLAHAQDGKLSYHSCCCLLGSTTADHALRSTEVQICDMNLGQLKAHPEFRHLVAARRLPRAEAVEKEFWDLAYSAPQPYCYYEVPQDTLAKDNAKRRERLIPLILAEMERRERNKPQIDEAERKHFIQAHRLEQEYAERFPEEVNE